jgi:hypothetical protein
MVIIPMILSIALSQAIPLVGKAQISVSSPAKTQAEVARNLEHYLQQLGTTNPIWLGPNPFRWARQPSAFVIR